MGPFNEYLAQIAYQAYGDKAGWKAFHGDPMPTWQSLPPHIQERWIAAMDAIIASFEKRDADIKAWLANQED
jgi:hypothetical protein